MGEFYAQGLAKVTRITGVPVDDQNGRPEGYIILEYEYRCRRRGLLCDGRENQSDTGSEFFWSAAYAADGRLTRIADEQEILRSDSEPFVCGLGVGGACDRGDNERTQKQPSQLKPSLGLD